jgi:hypothetical protein
MADERTKVALDLKTVTVRGAVPDSGNLGADGVVNFSSTRLRRAPKFIARYFPSLWKPLNAIPASAYFSRSGLSKPMSAVGGLAADLETAVHFGRRTSRPGPSLPRHVFGGAHLASVRLSGAGFNSLESSKCADRREALCAVGSGAAGAIGGRCSAHLAHSRTATRGTRRVHEERRARNSSQIRRERPDTWV